MHEAPDVVREDQRTDLSHEIAAQSRGGNGAFLNLLGALLLDPGEPWLGVGTLRNEVVGDVAPPSRALGVTIVGVLRHTRRLLSDETGNIQARLIGKYAPRVQQGQVVAIRNGRSEVYQEHHRLELDAFGQISVEKESLEGSLGEKNMSAIVYETRIVKTKE